jgi:hypothetical protein
MLTALVEAGCRELKAMKIRLNTMAGPYSSFVPDGRSRMGRRVGNVNRK